MEDMEIEQVDRKPVEKYNKRFVQELLAPPTSDLFSNPRDNEPTILEFQLEKIIDPWEVMYDQFSGFVQKHGHPHPPADLDHGNLRDWLNRQILNKRHLSESQFQRLDKLGIHWDSAMSRDHAWELMFTRLKDFSVTFGHCRVPYKWDKDKQLALWVLRQRKMHSTGKISEYRKRLLNEIGFTWQVQELYNTQWENYFQQLLAFNKDHNHCNVPGKEAKLVSWIERQRLLKKKKLLSAERENRLDQIKFIWDFNDIKTKVWDERYVQLSTYRKKNGHSFVPVNYKKNKQLGAWVATQRKLEAQSKLSQAKLKKLDKLDFVWSGETQSRLKSDYDSLWEGNYEKLKAYKQLYRTCQVSLKVDPLLQSWTVWQRKMFYEAEMPADRISRLNEIAFPWSINEGYWMKMFEMLKEFYNKFGHTHVPSQWSENPQLAGWVYRIRLNKNKLSTEKIDALNGLGFKWDLKRKTKTEWICMYNRLLEFKKEHGHTKIPIKWHKDPKLGKWVSRMRQEKALMEPDRLASFETIEFYWGKK